MSLAGIEVGCKSVEDTVLFSDIYTTCTNTFTVKRVSNGVCME